MKWRTKIIDWSPPRQFIDLQVRGPYALWHHQHTFTPTPSGGTDCRDRVARGMPVWYLVPDGVVQYIEKRGLYRGGVSGPARDTDHRPSDDHLQEVPR